MIHPTSNMHTTRKTVKWGEGWQWDFVIVFYDFIFRTFFKWIKSYESGKQRLWISHTFNKNSYSVHFGGSRGSEYYAFASKTTLFGVFFLSFSCWDLIPSYDSVAFKLMMMAAHNLRCAHFDVVVFLCV